MDGSVYYVSVKVGDTWLARICASQEEAVELQERIERWAYVTAGLNRNLEAPDVTAFAGPASDLASAHWQLREALGLS